MPTWPLDGNSAKSVPKDSAHHIIQFKAIQLKGSQHRIQLSKETTFLRACFPQKPHAISKNVERKHT
jgi:hypothetical protein